MQLNICRIHEMPKAASATAAGVSGRLRSMEDIDARARTRTDPDWTKEAAT